MNNICLGKEYCYKCEYEQTVYKVSSIIINRRRCIFGIMPDEPYARLTHQDNTKLRKNVFTDLMNSYLIEQWCHMSSCFKCNSYKQTVGSNGNTCTDIVSRIRNLHERFTFRVYEDKPKF